MTTSRNGLSDIVDVISSYFDGLHNGDIDTLSGVFDEHASLQAGGLRLTRDQWLDKVAQRSSPAELGHPYDYEILGIEVAGEEGVAKVLVPLLGKTYIDFLSCLKENGGWRIVNKLYAEIESV